MTKICPMLLKYFLLVSTLSLAVCYFVYTIPQPAQTLFENNFKQVAVTIQLVVPGQSPSNVKSIPALSEEQADDVWNILNQYRFRRKVKTSDSVPANSNQRTEIIISTGSNTHFFMISSQGTVTVDSASYGIGYWGNSKVLKLYHLLYSYLISV